MSEYKRFVSYIYAYDRGIKERNVGFAKVEARDGHCRLVISLKGAYGGNGREQEIYLYYREEEILKGIFIGNFRIENGAGEFRDIVFSDNIRDSGRTIADISGILIRSKEPLEIIYASAWDDHILKVENFMPAERKEAPLPFEDIISVRDVQGFLPKENKGRHLYESRLQAAQMMWEKKQELAKEQAAAAETASDEVPPSGAGSSQMASNRMPSNESGTGEQTEESMMNAAGAENISLGYNPAAEGENRTTDVPVLQAAEMSPVGFLWDALCKCCQKVRAFEEERDTFCLKIELKDLERLPRDNWVLGNNSFLLHGYYNYRYLLLAKPKDEEMILGIPGMYHQKERVMASLFGFDDFKPSKPCAQLAGQFGYWCRKVAI